MVCQKSTNIESGRPGSAVLDVPGCDAADLTPGRKSFAVWRIVRVPTYPAAQPILDAMEHCVKF